MLRHDVNNAYEALHRLARELGLPVDQHGDPIELLGRMTYVAWWRDDREEIRAKVAFEWPVSDLTEGPRADALRWLAGHGPPVERLTKVQRWRSL